MAYKMLALVALVAAFASADIPPTYSNPLPPYDPPQPYPHTQPSQYNNPHPSKPPYYNFEWNVKDDYLGNDFGHQETRDGYDTQGSYYNHLPDGRLQKVSYDVRGDSGYLAQVSYEGEAQYPKVYHQPNPTYHQPEPTYHHPEPTYHQPEPTYHQPEPAYQPPIYN